MKLIEFDGVLATYPTTFDKLDSTLGDPIPITVTRIKEWLAQSIPVSIFTNRIDPTRTPRPDFRDIAIAHTLITQWIVKHIGQELPLTYHVNDSVTEFFCSRAIQTYVNLGVHFSAVMICRNCKYWNPRGNKKSSEWGQCKNHSVQQLALDVLSHSTNQAFGCSCGFEFRDNNYKYEAETESTVTVAESESTIHITPKRIGKDTVDNTMEDSTCD